MEQDNKIRDLVYDVEGGIITSFRFKCDDFALDGRYTGITEDGVRDVYSVDLYDGGNRIFSQSPFGINQSERNSPSSLLETAMAVFCLHPNEMSGEFARDETPEQIEWRESTRRNDLDLIRHSIVEQFGLM